MNSTCRLINTAVGTPTGRRGMACHPKQLILPPFPTAGSFTLRPALLYPRVLSISGYTVGKGIQTAPRHAKRKSQFSANIIFSMSFHKHENPVGNEPIVNVKFY